MISAFLQTKGFGQRSARNVIFEGSKKKKKLEKRVTINEATWQYLSITIEYLMK